MSLPNGIEKAITQSGGTFMASGARTAPQAINSITKIAPALIKAQAAMGSAVKGSINPFFRSSYADLNSIREAVMPALHANGIAVLQPTMIMDGKNYVQTVLLHESGETISGYTEIVTAKQNDPQGAGIGISYARRYGLQSLLNVGAEDDDGEKAMGRGAKPSAAPKLTAAPDLVEDIKKTAVAKAQVAVARKVVTKSEILAQLGSNSASVTEAVNEAEDVIVKAFLNFIEGKLK